MALNGNENQGNHLALTQERKRVCDEQSNLANSTFTQEFNRADDERSNVVNSTFTEELNSVDDQISHIANSTFEQDDDKTQTNSESYSSFDITTDQKVSTDLYDGNDSSVNTVSYEGDSDAAFQQQASKQVSFLNYFFNSYKHEIKHRSVFVGLTWMKFLQFRPRLHDAGRNWKRQKFMPPWKMSSRLHDDGRIWKLHEKVPFWAPVNTMPVELYANSIDNNKWRQ